MNHHHDTAPTSYISNLDQLQSQSCSLCFEFSLQMRRCSNSCQKNICILCLRKRPQMRTCPFCGDRLQFQNEISNKVKFNCPSGNSQCSIQIRSLKQFLSHASSCTYIQVDLLKQFQYKTSNKCTCGLPLSFHGQKICQQCGLKGTSSNCSKCQIYFCTICRPLPCNKTLCMKGHRLQRDTALGYGKVCDLCEIPIFSLNIRRCYSDRECDFDICVFCYQKLSHDQNQPNT